MPTPYTPGVPPTDPSRLSGWVRKELGGVSEALAIPVTKTLATIAASQTVAIGEADLTTLTLGAGGVTVTIESSRARTPVGTVVRMLVAQDGTGSRTVSSWVNVTWPSATAPTLSTGAHKLDLLEFTKHDAGWFGRVLALNY